MRVVKALDVVEDSKLGLQLAAEAVPVDQFTLQRGKKALTQRVVITVLISGAGYAFVRYLMPLKLLLMVALVRWLSGHWEPKKAGAFQLVILLLVAFGLAKTTYRTFNRWGTLQPHMSVSLGFLEERLEWLQGKRIGMFESGRAGYRFPGQVLNLDGKSNLSALRAISENDFFNYLKRDEVQVLLFRDHPL